MNYCRDENGYMICDPTLCTKCNPLVREIYRDTNAYEKIVVENTDAKGFTNWDEVDRILKERIAEREKCRLFEWFKSLIWK